MENTTEKNKYSPYELIKEIPTEDKPLLIKNYPYGFKLKTDIIYFIETKGNKQRLGTRTLNPKTNKWNKTKYGTYSDIILLVKEKETGHIKNIDFSLTYSDKKRFDELLNFIGDFRTEHLNLIFKYAIAIYETRKFVKVSIRATRFKNKYTGEIKEVLNCDEWNDYEEIGDTEEEKEKQKKASEDLNKIFVHNALKEGLSVEELKSLK